MPLEDWTIWLTEKERRRCEIGDTWLQKAYYSLATSRALVAEMRQALRESDEAGLRGVGFTSLADLTRWRHIASLTEEDMLKQLEEK